MCGIYGYFDCGKNTISTTVLDQMGDVIEHRGPDGRGQYYDCLLYTSPSPRD